MRSRRNLWLGGTAAALVLAGLVLEDWRLLAIPLPLVVLLALATFHLPPVPRVSLRRSLEPLQVAEGQRVAVTLHLTNDGAPLGFLELLEALPGDFTLTRGTNHLLMSLGSGEEVAVEYEVEAGLAGEYDLGPVTLRARDPLGLFFEEATIGGTAHLVVIPSYEDLRKLDLNPHRTRPWFGQIRARRRGLGVEFWGLRDYDPADDLRHINWRASARTGDLITNEFEGEHSGDVVIVLDGREASALGPGTGSTIQFGIRAAVSLAARALANRNRVGLIIQRNVLDWVYPAFGRKQLFRLMLHLMAVRPGGTWPLEHVAGVLTRFFPPQSQVILISPLVDRRSVESVAELVTKGFEIVIVSPSPVEVQRPLVRTSPLAPMALRILSMERENLLAELRKLATVVDWDPAVPLGVPLRGVRASPHR